MTATQFPMFTLPIPPANPLKWNEQPPAPQPPPPVAEIESAEQAPPPPAPTRRRATGTTP